MHIRQEGSSVAGCYEDRGGTLQGAIEGRTMRLSWREKEGEDNEGSATAVFSGDAQRWVGLFAYKGEDPLSGRLWKATRLGSAVGTCPGWAGGVEQQLAKEIEQFGRARIYGINFDSDADRIREESRRTLEQIAAVLKSRQQWKITVEGHTDSTASAAHNQDLSARRARSVKQYLEKLGIAGDRLQTAGYGATQPVAGNESAVGRAANRRVELLRQIVVPAYLWLLGYKFRLADSNP